MRSAMAFHDFLEESQGFELVPGLGGVSFQNFTFMIDGTPQVMCFAIDLHEHLIHMPSPVGIVRGRVCSFLPDLTSEHGAKPVPPIADRFMAYVDAAFMQQVFDIAK